MTVDGWSVSPAQIASVLQMVDVAGEPLGTAVTDARDLLERKTDLMASGRSVIADAWQEFMDTRSLVPGMVIDVVTSSAQGVVEGTAAIVAGDEEMAVTWRSERVDLFESAVDQS